MRRSILIALVSLCFGACQSGEAPAPSKTPVAAPAAAPQATGESSFGQKLNVSNPVKVSALVSDSSPYVGKPIQLEGKISAVCQKAGCWMELVDEGQKVRVRVIAKDHGFGLPKDSSGKRAVAEGVLSQSEVPEAEAKHLAGEGAQIGSEGTQRELRLEATGVVLYES